MRNLRRSARRHQAGVTSEDYAEFTVGQRVLTTEGLPGTVTAVEDGVYPGDEQYLVELDDDLGGGEYAASEMQPLEGSEGDPTASSTTASLSKTADEDQCPYCAGDSMPEDGQYRCEEGHVWSPDDPAAQAYHGDGPERGQIQPTAEIKWDTPSPSAIIMELVEDFRGYCSVCRGQLWKDVEHVHDAPIAAAASRKELAFVAALRSKTSAIPLKCDGCGEVYFTDYLDGHGCTEGSLHDHWTAEAAVEAMTSHVASEDYPELAQILVDRPPLAHSERVASLQSRTDLGMPQVRTAASIPPIPDWAILQQFQQYPQHPMGGDGITYFKGAIDSENWVDCLLAYKDDELVGVLNHFPKDMGPERKGNVLLMVHPQHRREGIGTALWQEAKRRWGVTAAGQDQTPDGSAFTSRVGNLVSLGGFWTRLQDEMLPKILDAQERNGIGYWDREKDSYPTVDWCRFRHNRRCFYPRALDYDATQEAGYAVYEPDDRGLCPRDKWEDQKACPAPSEPGPNSGDPNWRYETWQSWKDGGQGRGQSRRGSVEAANVETDIRDRQNKSTGNGGLAEELAQIIEERRSKPKEPANPYDDSETNPYVVASTGDREFGFHLTARWSDVQSKAKRIRQAGQVRIISSSPVYLVGEVKGDNNIYQATLMREPGTTRVATWECGCAWAAYSWGRSGRWKKYEGRLCSHALALNYEAQSRGWGGKEISEDAKAPAWRKNKPVVVEHPTSPIGDWMVGSPQPTRAASKAAEEWEDTARPVSTEASLAEPPVRGLVRDMLADGDSHSEVLATLVALGVADAPRIFAEAMAAQPFPAQIRGRIVRVLDLLDDGIVDTEVGPASASDVLYPTYHPTRGLNFMGSKTAAPVPGQFESFEDVTTYMMGEAAKAEPAVTRALQEVAAKNHGEMMGLGFRLKTYDSLLRKVTDKRPDVTRLRDPFTEINGLYDALRYTIAYPEPDWGNSVQKTIWTMEQMGFRVLGEKNTWRRGDPYSGYHVNFVTQSGLVFELQFHTSSSFHLKDKILHAMFEEFRESRTPLPRRQFLYDEMTRYWDHLPIPDNALQFPGDTFLPRPVASQEDAIVVEPRDHLWGWRCTKCGETEVGTGRSGKGYAEKATAQEYGENHAMVCWDLDWGQSVNVREAGLQVRAAADTDGYMVAFTPPPHIAEAIHRDIDSLWGADAEHPTQYHVTLLYPGDSEGIDPITFEAAARDWASRQGPFTAKISGYGVFHQDGGDKVLYASIDAPGFGGPRQDLVDTMARFGIEAPENHGWTPHMTLVYSGEANTPTPPQELPEEALGEWTVSDVAIVLGKDWKRVSLDRAQRIDIGEGRDVAFGYLPWGQGEGDVAWAGPNHVAASLDDEFEDVEHVLMPNGERYPYDKVEYDPSRWGRSGPLAELHDEPEPALPATTAEDDDEDTGESLEEIVATFQRSAGAKAVQTDSRPRGGDDMDIAGAAKAHLAKEALKAFTPAEQKQIIEEGSAEGVVAANLDRLDLTGTHYTALEEALQAAEAEPDDETWMM